MVAMKNNTIISIFIFLLLSQSLFPNQNPKLQALDIIAQNEKLYALKKVAEELHITLKGPLLAYYVDCDNIYFIQETEAQWLISSYDINTAAYTEKAIPQFQGSIKKFKADNNFFYILVEKKSESNSESNSCTLIKIESLNLNLSSIEEISDFDIVDNKLLLIKSQGIEYNGSFIPILSKSALSIKQIIDERILLLSNGVTTEIIDLLAERNIYSYKGKSLFPLPNDYNLILEFSDSFSSPSETIVYYQVTVNSAEEIRTETSHPEIKKTLALQAEAGKYAIIKAERWELDKTKGRYVRANNIYQPGELKLFIPENRILRVKFTFDGQRYSITQSLLEN